MKYKEKKRKELLYLKLRKKKNLWICKLKKNVQKKKKELNKKDYIKKLS